MMAKSDNGDVHNRSSPSASNDPNNSFMKKVTSRVSGLIPSSLTKWFGETGRTRPVIRHREPEDDDQSASEDEESQPVQPPKKRARNSTFADMTFSAIPSSFTGTSTPLVHYDNLRSQPGTSGYSRNREYNTIVQSEAEVHLNGDDRSDSGESTSGYSSVPLPLNKDSSSDKESKTEVNTSKILNKSSSTPVRSLFSEQSLTPNKSCMSSRRPSFNASTFGSPSFVDRTLSTKRAINSPFYSGRTMYGGAANQRSRTIFPRDDAHKIAVKNSVQIKPVNEGNKEGNHLSKTAKRILDALEHFSSPIADARKIPVVNSREKKPNRGVSRDLIVPNMSELLRMKQKGRLQDSTVAVRNVALTSQSVLNTEYSLRVDDSENKSHTTKMKSKIASLRPSKSEILESAPKVVLPDIKLPINTLPKFDFSLPPPAVKLPPKASLQYKFASPISISDAPKSVASMNHFTFSQPIDAKGTTKAEPKVSPALGFKYTPPSTQLKRKEPKNNGQTDITATKLVSGSVMDVLGKEDLMAKFKPASGTWECGSCMVRNIPTATRCVACETLKEPNKIENNSLSQFKMSADKWECGVCMVRNDNASNSCVACTTPKPIPGATLEAPKAVSNPPLTASGFGDKFKPPSDTWECSVCMVRNKTDVTKCVACETPKPGSKPTKSTLIMPPETKQASGFGDLIKKQNERWECTTCLVRNPNDEALCTSCGTAKPGAAKITFGVSSTTPQFNFGIDKVSQPTGFKFGIEQTSNLKPSEKPEPTGFTFGVPASKKEEVVVIDDDDEAPAKKSKEEPKNTVSKSLFSVPTTAVASSAPTTTGFTFGAPKPFSFGTEGAKTSEAPQKTFTFGAESVKTTDASKISFDMPKVEEKMEKAVVEAPKVAEKPPEVVKEVKEVVPVSSEKKTEPVFSFGAPVSKSEVSSKPTPAFAFGAPKVESKTFAFGASITKSEPKPAEAPSFAFGAPAPKPEAKPFAFGAKTDPKSTFQVPQFNFGGGFNPNQKLPETPAPSFAFSGAQSFASKPEAKPYAFGAPTKPDSTAFNFKASDAAPKPVFNFGSSAPNTEMFSFKADKPAQPDAGVFGAPQGGVFGAPQSQPPQNGGSFAAPKIGSNSTQLFGFGQPAAPASAPFTFGAPAPAAASTFSPDVRPSFNFSSGAPASFTAQPASAPSSGAPVRKIRKAVRRMQPR